MHDKRVISSQPARRRYRAEGPGISRHGARHRREHHERWDGKGYPDGLAEPAIPLPARLMALADAFLCAQDDFERISRRFADEEATA